MPEIQETRIQPIGYVNREDARNLEAGMADCMIIMRKADDAYARPVFARPESAATLPLAGGEVEALAWRVLGYNFNTEAFALDYSRWGGDIEPVRYLVDRVHVTRLQADLNQMTTYRDNAAKHMMRIRSECTATEKERDALQSELTKARELLAQDRTAFEACTNMAKQPSRIGWYAEYLQPAQKRLREYFDAIPTNQSAPAAKGGSDE